MQSTTRDEVTGQAKSRYDLLENFSGLALCMPTYSGAPYQIYKLPDFLQICLEISNTTLCPDQIVNAV